MEQERRSTHKYTFKNPNTTSLKTLEVLVSDPNDFTKKYGKLLPLLKANMKEGLLTTLVQFYDPLYGCFTFPDYLLAPTLEEYSYLLGIPITDRVMFSRLEETPESRIIAATIHINESKVENHMIAKGGIFSLSSEFLIKKAHSVSVGGSTEAFEAILASLIYGLVLFPNIDKFVDINAIKIFLNGNPISTTLGDTYYSIHPRNKHK